MEECETRGSESKDKPPNPLKGGLLGECETRGSEERWIPAVAGGGLAGDNLKISPLTRLLNLIKILFYKDYRTTSLNYISIKTVQEILSNLKKI